MSLEVVRRRLREFAASYPDLALYRAICLGAVDDDEVAGLLTAARPGQDRPVLLLAALHDLVLRRPDVAAARWYPSVTGRPVPPGDPWPDVRATALAHATELRAVIASRATQTNEVNRVVHLGPLLAAAAADVAGAPVALVELGASAGLLLGLDRYRTALGDVAVLGDPVSPVQCGGEVRGDATGLAGLRLPRIVERVGLDLDPVDLGDADAVRWLEACLWPDVPGRLERFRAAVALLRADPPVVTTGDMVGDVGAVGHAARAVASMADPSAPAHLVVMTSWALTYVAREQRPLVVDALAALAADGRPVSWATAEPPGCVPELPVPPGDDSTVLGLRRWRHGAELPPAVVGTAHPHGAWLRWRG